MITQFIEEAATRDSEIIILLLKHCKDLVITQKTIESAPRNANADTLGVGGTQYITSTALGSAVAYGHEDIVQLLSDRAVEIFMCVCVCM